MAALVKETVFNNDADGSIRVKGGLGNNSYFKNSVYQRLATNAVKDIIDDAIFNKLDVKSLLTTSNTIALADLGCAVGPNTFTSMQNIIDVIKNKYQSQNPNWTTMPEFQVFFNDKTSNDFNTLFTSLPPDREYFAAGVPGSFYHRLFAESSLHVVQSHYAVYWLSKVPEELEDKNSTAWNKGRIHYANATNGEVLKAYARQWAEDFNDFLNARAKEIVPGGLLIVVMPSIPDGMPYSQLANGILFNCLESILVDMARRGVIEEEEVDEFNMPIYAAPPGEFAAAVEKNGSFKIEEMGLANPAPWLTDGVHVDMIEFLRHIRAAWEGMFIKQFPTEIVNEIFQQLTVKLPEVFEQMETAYKDKIQSHYVLQRK
ncbi:hypothetical protein JCGZ_04780 [Jatropha curcas]|uniref:Uncharacterized protein n=1 Tax=Jatropha curcas TaxID=180498 RepID=A0A067KPS3_JATCU|nr:loganic acid O-methyltransferase [Jatropha curcas]KDP38137.1 hypothetical protein JCGZ_04780 [Jatropha curcas]